jgi:hypothetical protein
MALLLAYPVTRWQVVIGKFLGHLAILAFATVVGFGAAGFALWLGGDTDPASWRAFAVFILSSVTLGGAFLAIGYVVSIAVRHRGAAGAIAIGVWLLARPASCRRIARWHPVRWDAAPGHRRPACRRSPRAQPLQSSARFVCASRPLIPAGARTARQHR